LWPLLCSCITLAVLFFFLEKYSGLTHASAAGLLLATNTLQIDYSDSLFPDVIVGMFAFLFIVQIFKGRLEADNHWRRALIATVFFYLGFLAKEIIIFVLPFVFIQLIIDMRKKQSISFWRKLVAAMTVGGFLFLGAYFILTGELNFIYQSVETRHSEFYMLNSVNEIISRLTYGPAVMIGENVGHIILFLFAICFLVLKSWKDAGANSTAKFFVSYFLILLLTYWFVPISFSHFSFIHLDPRMWMMLLVPLYIIGGYIISRPVVEKNDTGIKILAGIFLFAAIIALIFVSSQRALMFMTFALSPAFVLLLRKKIQMGELWQTVILLSPAVILALRFTVANSNF
jgi:hypothetical protein